MPRRYETDCSNCENHIVITPSMDQVQTNTKGVWLRCGNCGSDNNFVRHDEVTEYTGDSKREAI